MANKERILPALDNLSRASRLRIFCGLMGGGPEKWLLSGSDQEIDSSLKSFIDEINSSGVLTPFFLEYFFKDQRGWFTKEGEHLYSDAPRNFLLEEGRSNDSGGNVLALISFLIVGADEANPLYYPKLKMDSLRKDDVLVTQIQAKKGLSQENRLDLKRVRWEMSLLNSVVDWAQGVGLPRVLVVPSANNYWSNNNYGQGGKDLGERLFLRYDVTARRCGFKQEEKNSPYLLELPNKTLFNAF